MMYLIDSFSEKITHLWNWQLSSEKLWKIRFFSFLDTWIHDFKKTNEIIIWFVRMKVTLTRIWLTKLKANIPIITRWRKLKNIKNMILSLLKYPLVKSLF